VKLIKSNFQFNVELGKDKFEEAVNNQINQDPTVLPKLASQGLGNRVFKLQNISITDFSIQKLAQEIYPAISIDYTLIGRQHHKDFTLNFLGDALKPFEFFYNKFLKPVLNENYMTSMEDMMKNPLLAQNA